MLERALVLTALLSVAGSGCGQLERHRTEAKIEEHAPAALKNYAEIAHAAYGEALAGARTLQAAATALVTSPGAERLQAARQAWLDARVSYAQTEVFRFYDGPIDEVEMFINSWPVDENYIESANGAKTGLIDDLARHPEISRELLTASNEKDSETNVSTGYHALEFLLWGRDTNADGPGQRAFSDFVDDAASPLARRRGKYLLLGSELLVEHLTRVDQAWSPERHGNYREKFLAMPAAQALGLVIKGMGTLSGPELSGERLTVAYETKDQENEHSCFSDSTREDVVASALGIENVCLGRYQGRALAAVKGPGFCALLSELDPELGAALTEQTAASVRATREIPAPFDRAILGDDAVPGRRAVLRAIRALEAQTSTLTKAAATLGTGIALATEVPK